MSYELATLGDVTAEDPAITAWRGAVRARGNTDVIAPRSLAFSGYLAERITASKVPAGMIYPAPSVLLGSFWYVPAPKHIQDLWRDSVAADQSAIATEQFVENVQAIPGDILTDTGKLVRTGVSAITGIPTWAIPVLLIGGGAFVLMSAAHSFLPDRRAK